MSRASAASHPAELRDAAIADYRTSGEPMRVVAKRHGIAKTTLASWIGPVRVRGPRSHSWTEAELTYTGGWYVRGGVRYPLLPEQRSA